MVELPSKTRGDCTGGKSVFYQHNAILAGRRLHQWQKTDITIHFSLQKNKTKLNAQHWFKHTHLQVQRCHHSMNKFTNILLLPYGKAPGCGSTLHIHYHVPPNLLPPIAEYHDPQFLFREKSIVKISYSCICIELQKTNACKAGGCTHTPNTFPLCRR